MKRSINLNFVTFFTIFFLVTTGLFAQTIHERSNLTQIFVNDIELNEIETDSILLRGHLTEKIGDQKFIFSDDTGEIIVYINDEFFPLPRKITNEDMVEIVGKIIWNPDNNPEVVANYLKIILE